MSINLSKNKKRQAGTALLVTILLAGAISAIAFGMTKITLNEIFTGNKSEEGMQAYYAAQAGTEDGLMRFKFHDQASLEVPEGAYKDDPNDKVLRVYLNDPNDPSERSIPKYSTTKYAVKPDLTADDYVYDLKVWYKEKCDTNNPCEFTLTKDQSVTLDISEADDISVNWDVYNASDQHINFDPVQDKDKIDKTGLWYRLLDPTNPIDPKDTNKEFFTYFNCYTNSNDPKDCPASSVNLVNARLYRNRDSNFLDKHTAKTIKFKAFLPALPDGLKIIIKIKTDGKIGGPITHIESTGYYGGTAKKIEVTVDRESKSILDIFDYVIYSGQGPLPRR